MIDAAANYASYNSSYEYVRFKGTFAYPKLVHCAAFCASLPNDPDSAIIAQQSCPVSQGKWEIY